jgi:hypothetical protein
MTKKKPSARIVFEQHRDEYAIMSDVPVEVLVVDHTWPDGPRRVLNRPVVRAKDVEKEFSKRCPACKHSIALCICQRVE